MFTVLISKVAVPEYTRKSALPEVTDFQANQLKIANNGAVSHIMIERCSTSLSVDPLTAVFAIIKEN